MKTRLLPLLLALPFLVVSCQSRLQRLQRQFDRQKQAEYEQIRAAADRYLSTVIADEALLSRIRFDTISRSGANLVLYSVLNNTGRLERNLLIVRISTEFVAESASASPQEVLDHLEDPEIHPLLISRQQAVSMARARGLEEGVRPWKVELIPSGPRPQDLNWSITNTLQSSTESVSRGKGKILQINAYTGKIEELMWNSIS